MKPIEKSTLLTALVIILVALNIGLLGFMWYSQHADKRPETPWNSHFLSDQLAFTPEQQQKYTQLQKGFGDSVRAVQDRERKVHDRFFEIMHADAPNDSVVNITLDSMGLIRLQIERITYNHFRQVRALCTDEQKARFDKIIGDAMRHMGPRPDRGGRPAGPPPPADREQ